MTPEMLQNKPHGKSIDWYGVGAILYEMIVSIPPYFNPNKDQLYENIIKAPLKLPGFISEECQNLIKNLLIRNPQERLGATDGFQEVKAHPWFSAVNWEKVYNRAVPMESYPEKVLKQRQSKINMKSLMKNPAASSKANNFISNWDYTKKELAPEQPQTVEFTT